MISAEVLKPNGLGSQIFRVRSWEKMSIAKNEDKNKDFLV